MKQSLQKMREAQAGLVGRSLLVTAGDLRPLADELAATIERIEGHVCEQERCALQRREATRAKAAVGRRIREEYLRPLSAMARVVFADEAAELAAFALGDTRRVAVLVMVARRVAGRLRTRMPRFVAQGLAADFLVKLSRELGELAEAERGEVVALALGREARVGVRGEVRRGRGLVGVLGGVGRVGGTFPSGRVGGGL